MVNEFIARVFSGSAKPLLVHLVDDTTLDQDEVAEIEARVKEKRDKSRPSAKRRREGCWSTSRAARHSGRRPIPSCRRGRRRFAPASGPASTHSRQRRKPL